MGADKYDLRTPQILDAHRATRLIVNFVVQHK